MIRPKITTQLAVAVLVPAGLYYALLLTIHKDLTHVFDLLAPTYERGLTFNSMLLHLLRGSFDVDPHAIGTEGFVRDGKTYAYFGIIPALFRIPFLVWPNFETTDFTRLSCLTAVCLMASWKLMSAVLIWRAAPSDRSPALFIALIAVILFGGAQIEFLKPNIYEETMLWSNAFAAAFIYFMLVGIVSERGYTDINLSILAIIAGLCLLTRVTTGVGLCAALGLLWIQLTGKAVAGRATGQRGVGARTCSSRPGLLSLLLPALILTVCALFIGFMNVERWGNPLTFIDYSKYLIYTNVFPERFVRFKHYGIFNVVRLGYGLMYYFVPLWAIRDHNGDFLWSNFSHRALDGIEIPPNSFIVSDSLLVGLAVYMLIHLVRYRDIDESPIVASTVAGLSIPAVLMLTFQFMSPRYRMEFYPALEFSAFMGFRHLISQRPRPSVWLFASAAIFGIVFAQIFWFFLMISPGDAIDPIRQLGWIVFYRSRMPF